MNSEGSVGGQSLLLSLCEGAELIPAGDGELTIQTARGRTTLKRLTPAARDALQLLGAGGANEAAMERSVLERDGTDGLTTFYFQLQQLGRRGLLWRSAADERGPLMTLVPISPHFTYFGRSIHPAQSYAVSRFSFTRADEGRALLESPLAHAQVVLRDWRAGALVQALARPCRAAEVAHRIPGLSPDAVATMMNLLLNAALLGQADESGIPATDRNPALQSWEFHDLLFHSRSREGRHELPVGATWRLAGRLEPPPAVKLERSGEFIQLSTPDLARLERDEPPFAQLVEQRRSSREYGEPAITVEQLGEFLYRVARVKNSRKMDCETPVGPVPMEFTSRPYPAGGALYELEFYVVIQVCEGLTPGLYHYDPKAHRLGRLIGLTTEVAQLLSGAGTAAGIPEGDLQVLLVLAARFERLAWKYAAIAYALILKHVGVLYQTMYLTATAMKLAPCALGCGNADLFARAAGTDYYAETSVGEFLLGSLGQASSQTAIARAC